MFLMPACLAHLAPSMAVIHLRALCTGAEPDIFIWGGPLEGPVLQQGELSMVCVGLSERDPPTPPLKG